MAATKAGLPNSNRPGKTKGRKGGKGITLAEAAEGLALFPRGGPCNCQASRHKLVNNCLGCGKIVCEQEGEGPCKFCGALVLKEGSDYAGLEGISIPPANEAEAAAQAFKDRLVEFDRSAAQRTTVIDDQSDYFEIDGNAWLSDKVRYHIGGPLIPGSENVYLGIFLIVDFCITFVQYSTCMVLSFTT